MPYAVITGISRGIGRAIAERFATAGWTIAGSASSAQSLAAVQADHPDWHLYPVDLSNPLDCQQFATQVLKHGVPQVLVNNAGRFLPGSIEDEAEGTFETMMATNVGSAYHLTRALLPHMRTQRQGSVVNICSTASLKGYPNGGSYGISKHALLGLTRTLREELKPHGLRAIAVLPGATYTDSWKPFAQETGTPESRFMSPADVADLVFLACTLPSSTVLEEIVLRPLEGDI